MREFDLIEKYLKPLTQNHPASLFLSDDAAVISPKANTQLVVSCDSIVEGIHFLPNASADTIAKKLVGVNLSDIAAMGAMPQFGLIAAIFPKGLPEEWFKDFCETFDRLNKKYDICLIGGDTVFRDGPITLTMTIIGQVDKYKAITQNGANPGDNVYVTGTIGDAAIGLLVDRDNKFELDRPKKVYFTEKYRAPDPRVELGKKLNGSVTAMTDISDGFIRDLTNIANNSNVSIEINSDKIPYSKYLKDLMKSNDLQELALTGGDDYELLFTAPKIFHNQLMAIARSVSTKVSLIGNVTSGSGVKILDEKNQEIIFKNSGYQH